MTDTKKTKTTKTMKTLNTKANEAVTSEAGSISNEKLYEGLICLDVKLSKLIDIMDKLYQIAEQKQTGGNNTLKKVS